MMGMVRLEGNTYPVKDALQALGARWDRHGRYWIIPEERARDAMALIAQAPEQSRFTRKVPPPRERRCEGCHQRINYGRYCGKCEFGGR